MKDNRIRILVDCHFFDNNFVHGARVYLKGLYSILIKKDNCRFQFYFAAFNKEKLIKEFGINKNITYVKYKSTNSIYRLLFDIPKIIKTIIYILCSAFFPSNCCRGWKVICCLRNYQFYIG